MLGLFAIKDTATHIKTGAILLTLILSLSACGGGVVGNAENYFVVKDQDVIQLDEIVIESAKIDQDVLIVIYSESPILDETPSSLVVGYKSLSKGEYQNIVIQLNAPAKDNQTFYAKLWADNGTIGELELGGIDSPILQTGTSIVSFGVSYSTNAYIEAYLNKEGQYVTSNPEEVVLKKVIVAQLSWIAVYQFENGEMADLLGYQLLSGGHHSNVIIRIKPNVTLVDSEAVIIKTYQQVDTESNQFDPLVDKLNTNEGSQLSFPVVVQLR